jgi:hypothetical protein
MLRQKRLHAIPHFPAMLDDKITKTFLRRVVIVYSNENVEVKPDLAATYLQDIICLYILLFRVFLIS